MTFNFNVGGLTPQDAQTGSGSGSNTPVVVYAGESFNSEVGGGGAVIETVTVPSTAGANATTVLNIPQTGYYELSAVIQYGGVAKDTQINFSAFTQGSSTASVFVESVRSPNPADNYKQLSTIFYAQAGDTLGLGFGNAGTTSLNCVIQRFAIAKI